MRLAYRRNDILGQHLVVLIGFLAVSLQQGKLLFRVEPDTFVGGFDLTLDGISEALCQSLDLMFVICAEESKKDEFNDMRYKGYCYR